tara:strand:+ start:1574 stop:2446 length:873 start_codon:yes stop_codon:yes gene_type:complete
MPKATAVWLIENTALTFDQISDFCGLHPLEVQSIADGEAAIGMVGYDPITNGQLTQEEIDRCGADPDARLEMAEVNVPRPTARTKGPRYTPVARRQDRPDAIAWLVRNFPQLSDGQISKLVGTTKPTINGVRDRTHWNINNIKPRDPVALGLVARDDLTAAIEKANRAVERAEKRKEKEAKKVEQENAPAATADQVEESAPPPTEPPIAEAPVSAEAPTAEPELKPEDVFAAPPETSSPAPEPAEEAAPEEAAPAADDDGNPFAALSQLLPQDESQSSEESDGDTEERQD